MQRHSPTALRRALRNVHGFIGRQATFYTLGTAGGDLWILGTDNYSTAIDRSTGSGTTPPLEAGLTHNQLGELVDFCGGVKDLKTQPGEIQVEPGETGLLFRDPATSQEHQLPLTQPAPNTGAALRFFDELPALPDTDTVFTVHPDRLVRLGQTSAGGTRFPLSIMFKAYPGDTSKVPHLMCVRHGTTFRAIIASANIENVVSYLQTQGESNYQEALW